MASDDAAVVVVDNSTTPMSGDKKRLVIESPSSAVSLPAMHDMATGDAHSLVKAAVHNLDELVRLTSERPRESLAESDIGPLERLRSDTFNGLIRYVDSNGDEPLDEQIVVAVYHAFSRIVLDTERNYCERLQKPLDFEAEATTTSDDDDKPDEVTNFEWHHHRAYMYDLALATVQHAHPQSFPIALAKRIFDAAFIRGLVERFYVHDPSEEVEVAKLLLHRVYAKYVSLRRCFRSSMNDVIEAYIFNDQYCVGMSEILDVYAAIISGFVKPLKKENVELFHRVFIPLMKKAYLGDYSERFTHCLHLFNTKDNTMVREVLRSLCRFWPRLNPRNAVIYIGIFEAMLPETPPGVMAELAHPIFSRVAACIDSPYMQLSECACLLFQNDLILRVVERHASIVMPTFFNSVYRVVHRPALDVETCSYARWPLWLEMKQKYCTSILNKLEELNSHIYREMVSTMEKRDYEEAQRQQRHRQLWLLLERGEFPFAGTIQRVESNDGLMQSETQSKPDRSVLQSASNSMLSSPN